MLRGKTIVIGVTGSIAAYKAADLTSTLIKAGCDVHVVMTENAKHFINPITFETLTNHKCLVETFDRNFEFHVAHVSLSQKADLMVIAPATANIIGKMAHGIADDMLSTMTLAATCPIIVAPAMNTHMYRNAVVQDNIARLSSMGMTMVTPATGRLACACIGEGKLPDTEVLMSYIRRVVAYDKDLIGRKVLVTAGPTQESLDPVRYVSNHSTGKMGYAIAKAAMERGAEVTLVSGPTALQPPMFVEVLSVTTAHEMFEAVRDNMNSADYIVKAAAVADYTSSVVAEEKIKKSGNALSLDMVRTTDILKYVGEHRKDNQVICGFSMETECLVENSRKKLVSKNVDIIVANNLKMPGAGFGVDTNVVTLITADEVIPLDIMSKEEVAHNLLDKLLTIEKSRTS